MKSSQDYKHFINTFVGGGGGDATDSRKGNSEGGC